MLQGFDYLLLPRLEVRNANAASNYWILSPETVIAARQMAHALARHLGVVEQEAGVAIVHHHVELLGERLPKDWAFRPQQRRAAAFIDRHDYSSKNKHALSIQPTASMHLRLSLVLRFRAGTPLKASGILDFLRGGRLAGGQIIEHGEIEFLSREEAVWERLRSGHLIVERPDLLEPQNEADDRIHAFFTALTGEAKPDGATAKPHASEPPESAESPKAETETAPDTKPKRAPWVVPATLGYAAITDIAPRAGAREGHPAAFAEALTGLVQYRPLAEARKEPLPFWDYAYPEPGVFIVTQHPQPARG